MAHAQQTIAIFISFSGDGGVEKMVSNLARGFLDAGYRVDFILIKAKGSHLEQIPTGARVIRLNAKTSMLSLLPLVRYLRAERPAALLAAKDRAGRVALLARRLAGVPTRIVVRLGMNLSASLAGKSRLAKATRYYPIRWLYPWADAIVTVSQGVADDIVQVSRLDPERVHVVANPTVTPELHRLAAEPLADDWFAAGGSPRVLAVGRLTAQKDFMTLLHAFAQLRRQRDGRLLILGEGPLRGRLEQELARLGLQDCVRLPGFSNNPYAYMAQADLFVLSSAFEGSPNVLKEALALGAPVAATDCPSGPREILQDGHYGPLVPVGDATALAEAMAAVLAAPPARERQTAAVADYTLAASTRAYLEVLGLPASAPSTEDSPSA